MVFFVVPLKVPLLLWTLLIASTSSDKIKGNSTGTSILTNFLRQLVLPYIEGKQLLNDDHKKNPTENQMLTQIENAIRQKIIKLKPMLQDTQNNYKIKLKNNVKLDKNDKTTVLEFLSENNRKGNLKSSSRETQQETDALNNKIEKYKELRQRIKSLLHEEKTSASTSKLITRTLDEMLALIERKRQGKIEDSEDVVNYLLKNAHNSVKRHKEDGHYKLMCFLKPDEPNLHSNIYSTHQKYGSPRMKSSDKTNTRESKIKVTNQCDGFKVCSEELRDFLRITYHRLNETAVSTFTNYVAMYLRDVIEENKSAKDVVGSELEHLSSSAETKVNEIFLKELEHFTLDENKDKTVNTEHIKNFIKAAINHIKSSIHRLIEDKLSAMKTELFSTMKDDLTVNFRMDMDNLNRLSETSAICSFFLLCNGTPRGTKRYNMHESLRQNDGKNIFVQRRLNDNNSSVRVGELYLNLGQEQSITEPRSHVIESKKYSYANVNRSNGRSIATAEGTFSSENTDQFFK